MKVLDPQIAERECASIAAEDVSAHLANTSMRPFEDLRFELGLWAHGLDSFFSVGRHAFRGEKDELAEKQNYRNEFHITLSVLLKCGELIEELGRVAGIDNVPPGGSEALEFHRSIKPLILCGTALLRNKSLDFAEWNAWSEIVGERLSGSDLYRSFDEKFDEMGLVYLPSTLAASAVSPSLEVSDRDDLRTCLSRLGGILRSLDVVREMLDSDSPLKPSLAVFAFVYEAVNDLVLEIGERLSRRTDETSEIFGMFDATAYTLTIESKKVYAYELADVIGTRSASIVFARTEAAFGLLNDNIRQLLAGFAKLAEPDTDATALFPEFVEKLDQSIELRTALWSILEAVRAAETEASDEQLNDLRPRLDAFIGRELTYLFYKDRETFERFCEEIMASTGGPDLRPLLHRFSAYVETLFNQVGMRVVLANHPFAPE